MRLSGRDIQPDVKVSPDTVRPIRLRAAGLVFGMNTAEAMHLATQLADAVDEIHNHEGNAPS
ncbi:hypothetical protein [Mycolicibacterium sp. SCSIO 43805]|uniref:hypothetical protein n=1 Tax=Mycolicibacterium sp. SCSIO 43805 TaxID=3378074 RepID=UPI003AB599C7